MTTPPLTAADRPAEPTHSPHHPAAALCYLLLGVLLLVLFGVTATRGEWVSDSWIHAATVSEVARHPLHPLEPLTGERAPFAYFSPWAMVLGWLVKATGLSVWTVLTTAGLFCTALLLTAWYRLVRVFTAARWAPPVALVLLCLLWGTGAWFWSGFPSLGTMTVGFTWPSVLAAALWFEAWRTALRVDSVRRAYAVAVFAVLPGLVLLIHPFTAVLAGVSVGITLLGRLRVAPRRVLLVAVTAVLSGVLATRWPWIDMTSMFGDKATFDSIHYPLYRDLGKNFLLLVLTVPALLWRLRAARSDPLFWTAAVCGAGAVVGGLTHVWSLGRLGPGVALPGQLALAVLLAESWDARRRLTAASRALVGALAGLTGVALVVGGNANAWAVARALPDAQRASAERRTDALPPYPPMSWISPHVAGGGAGIANYWLVRRQLPVYGLRTVEPPWPSPGVPDESRRVIAEERMLGWQPATRTERNRLLARYHVRWIVWRPTARAPRWPFPGARRVACGPQRMALLR
ncbi:MAG: hypothetical protein WCA46_20410, partial [Actinocatenispora sp.]